RTAGHRDPLPTLVAEPRVFFNEALNGQWFIVPGLIVVVTMLLSAFLTSLCVAREYERNTIEQILVSPVSGPALMLGKLAPYLAVGAIQVASVTLASHVLFEVPIRGSLLFLSGASLLFLVGAQALGLALSAALRSQQVAMQMSIVITVLPSILLSGFVFPIRNMPWVLQILSWVVPARYFIRIVRGVFLKGVGPAVLWPELIAMVVFAFLMILLATSRFRRSLQ
ncbi:MAG: ABC transporter permease, partial [Deltaproteobacteria bacterium]|nr:ABC transporter permease [Deltaproteobacteria bacterium]